MIDRKNLRPVSAESADLDDSVDDSPHSVSDSCIRDHIDCMDLEPVAVVAAAAAVVDRSSVVLDSAFDCFAWHRILQSIHRQSNRSHFPRPIFQSDVG